MSKVRRRSVSLVSRIVFPRAKPALLIRMVGSPTWVRISAAVDLMALLEARSQWKKCTLGGARIRHVSDQALDPRAENSGLAR